MRDRALRHPCDTELEVVHALKVSVGHLVNISTSGALLKQVGCLPQDALVILCHHGVCIPARVVWSTELRTGVRFVIPLPTTDIKALRGAISSTSVAARKQRSPDCP